MKTWLIWIIAVAIAAVPVGWLVWRNPRAAPIGALLVALVVIGYFGALGIAGGGYNPETRPAEAAAQLTKILIVLAVLAAVSLAFMKGSPLVRVMWTAGSTLTWTVATLVLYGGFLQVQQVGRDAQNEAFLAPRRELEKEAARRRAELDLSPQGRRSVLDTALMELKSEVARRYEKLERVLIFGDPVSAPDQVVVWGVLTMRPDSPWERWGFEGQELHWQMNERLRQSGYPAKISLGFAPTAAVDGAGGDEAYFGADGARVTPQFGRDNIPRPFRVPEQQPPR